MSCLHSCTHTLSATHIHDYSLQEAAVTFSDRRVLHYACQPDGGPVRHVLNPGEPHRCRPVYAEPREGEPPAPLICPDGDLAYSLLNGVDRLVADLYRWQAHRHNAPLRRYAVCIERENDPDLRVPVITVCAACHLHAVAVARCRYPAIVGRTVAVWRNPDSDARHASVLTA